MEAPIHRRFSFVGGLLRDNFCSDDLKRECNRGYKRQYGIDDSSVTESFRAQEPRDYYIVGEINARCEARSREQNDASRDNASL